MRHSLLLTILSHEHIRIFYWLFCQCEVNVFATLASRYKDATQNQLSQGQK